MDPSIRREGPSVPSVLEESNNRVNSTQVDEGGEVFKAGQEDILEYCLEFMFSKEHRQEFLAEIGCEVSISKRTSYAEGTRKLAEAEDVTVTLDQVRNFLRGKWGFPNLELHLEHLESGLLEGHSWHGAAPSVLHLSIQREVRRCIAEENKLSEFLEFVKDIGKHEYFIVAVHDVTLAVLVKEIDNVIPATRPTSVSDFVFGGIPYDLKVTSVPEGSEFERLAAEPGEFAREMYEGADSARLRKQAKGSVNDWALNRMYVVLENEDRWLEEPRAVLVDIVDLVSGLDDPYQVTVNGITILAQTVLVPGLAR